MSCAQARDSDRQTGGSQNETAAGHQYHTGLWRKSHHTQGFSKCLRCAQHCEGRSAVLRDSHCSTQRVLRSRTIACLSSPNTMQTQWGKKIAHRQQFSRGQTSGKEQTATPGSHAVSLTLFQQCHCCPAKGRALPSPVL